jgi:hypothetical protein
MYFEDDMFQKIVTMGAGKTYTALEIKAIAQVKLANQEHQLGPAWWERMAEEKRLPQILLERIRNGGDIAKFINRNPILISEAITKLVMSKTAAGRSHLKQTLI